MSSTAVSHLGVFHPSKELSSNWTLGKLFRDFVRPLLVLAADRNIDQYEETMGLWDLYTGCPTLAQIDEDGPAIGTRFVRGLRSRLWRGEPLSDNTVRKHCIHAQAMLHLAGPSVHRKRSKRCTLPAPIGLISNPPFLMMPEGFVPEVEDAFTLDEIEQQYGATDVTSKPEYFRALFRFAYNTAFRSKTLFLFQPKWLKEDELGWWAKVPANAIKGGRSRKFYLNAQAMTAIRLLLAGASPTDCILARPYEKSWFYKQLHMIQAEAGLPEDRWFGLHAFRKACSTELSAINPMAASWHLGHSTGSPRDHAHMTLDHYTHRRALVPAVKMLPQPEWRCRRQMRLF